MALSDYLAKKLIEKAFGGTNFTPAATLYVRLYTAPPATTGSGGTEVTGGGYAPVALTNNTTTFPAASLVGGIETIDSGVVADFGTFSAGVGTVTHAALWDASSGGNMYCVGALSVARTIGSGDSFKFPVAGIILTQS